MSTTYFSYLLAGVSVADVLKKHMETVQYTKYNEDTGEPYQISKTVERCFIGAVDVTEYCRDGMLYLPECDEYDDYDEDDTPLSPLFRYAQVSGCPTELIGLKIMEVDNFAPIAHLRSLRSTEEKLRQVSKVLEEFGVTQPVSLFLVQSVSP